MLALLIEELDRVMIEVYDGETKIITSDLYNSIDYVNISNKIIQILDYDKSQTYLGKFINATSTRSTFELQHRIKVAWHAFHKHRRWLLNRNILIKLKLRLFFQCCDSICFVCYFNALANSYTFGSPWCCSAQNTLQY